MAYSCRTDVFQNFIILWKNIDKNNITNPATSKRWEQKMKFKMKFQMIKMKQKAFFIIFEKAFFEATKMGGKSPTLNIFKKMKIEIEVII